MSGFILGLDASTPRCVLVLGRAGGELVASDDKAEPPNQTSARLLPALRELVARAGITPADIDAVGCGCGPGTFTGTRVAVATAKGIALGLSRPTIGVSTLAAMAFSADVTGRVLPLLDARRGEVYGGMFACTLDPPALHPHSEEQCTPLPDLVASLDADDDVTPVGTGVTPYADALPDAWRDAAIPLPGPTPAGLWRAISAATARDAPQALRARYLRKSYAELGVNRPKRPFKRSPFV